MNSDAKNDEFCERETRDRREKISDSPLFARRWPHSLAGEPACERVDERINLIAVPKF